MDMLTALGVFRAVVEQGSFAGAARRLQLSPAAISKNIAELEGHVGLRLLHRSTRRLSLTEGGSYYFDRIVRVLDDLEQARETLTALVEEPVGVLRVSAPLTLGVTRLSTAVPALLEKYPRLSLDLHLDDRRVDLIGDGFDLAVRGSDALEDSGLVARKLTTLRHVVCGAPAYVERFGKPASPAELRNHLLVQFSLSGHADEWSFVRSGETVRVPVKGRYRVSSSIAVRDALREGFGLSLVPRIYVEEDLAAGRLVELLPEWSANETTIYAIYPSRRHMVAKVRVFLEFLTEIFNKDADPA